MLLVGYMYVGIGIRGTCDESCVGRWDERTSRQRGVEMVGLGLEETRHVSWELVC